MRCNISSCASVTVCKSKDFRTGKMGANQSIQHFGHKHLLRLLNIQQHPTMSTVLCSSCKLVISKRAYCCLPCNFCLHWRCLEMPHKLRPWIDPKHMLTLTPTPEALSCATPAGHGLCFSYHCKKCKLNLRYCASSLLGNLVQGISQGSAQQARTAIIQSFLGNS
ncbi:hypothetical protein ACJRO7_007342 [Eucalyptus globulus]|uniref:DC1 domain-containing protein n=1 Tax=Eucalyptus globulus TaxID=34317 RepID=A0ABD3INZ5_EUCGL